MKVMKILKKQITFKQYCEYPMDVCSILDGNVFPCTQVSNNELVMGNINENIWRKYGIVTSIMS